MLEWFSHIHSLVQHATHLCVDEWTWIQAMLESNHIWVISQLKITVASYPKLIRLPCSRNVGSVRNIAEQHLQASRQPIKSSGSGISKSITNCS